MQLPKHFAAQAIIFDKDGTLIDFDFMWGTWTLELARRLQAIAGLDARAALCSAYGYDLVRRKIIPDGKLTCTPIWRLREMMLETARSLGLSSGQARWAVDEAWFVPDPVTLAKPFTDLDKLFTNIQKRGIKIAIATADDRDATEAMLRAFRISGLVDTMVCAYDGIPSKPAPGMVTTICERLRVPPSKAIVIGDTVADLQMARSAGAGYAVGVLSGVGSPASLTPLANILVDTIDSLQESFLTQEHLEPALLQTKEDIIAWSPGAAF